MSETGAGCVVRFGVFEADLDARELRKHGLRVKLQDQPFQVLALIFGEESFPKRAVGPTAQSPIRV